MHILALLVKVEKEKKRLTGSSTMSMSITLSWVLVRGQVLIARRSRTGGITRRITRRICASASLPVWLIVRRAVVFFNRGRSWGGLHVASRIRPLVVSWRGPASAVLRISVVIHTIFLIQIHFFTGNVGLEWLCRIILRESRQ